MPDPTLFGLVVDQLAANPPTTTGADELVLAAFEGAASLEASLADGRAKGVGGRLARHAPPAGTDDGNARCGLTGSPSMRINSSSG
jgi:hypothetical protein